MVASKLIDAARAISLMATSSRLDLEQGARSLFNTDRPLFGTPNTRRNASKAISKSFSSPRTFFIIAVLFCIYTIFSSHRMGPDSLDGYLPHGRSAFGLEEPLDLSTATTLIVYDFQGLDEEDVDNLRFFLAVGVAPDDGNRYVIVSQEQLAPHVVAMQNQLDGGVAEQLELLDQDPPAGYVFLPPLESLPPNVDVFTRPNEPCRSPWGVLGWLLEYHKNDIDFSRFQNFILADSSVRGPFLPAHWPPLVHWSTALLARLQGTVHMAGAAISTDPTKPGPYAPAMGQPRPQPRIRPGLVAFDQAALAAIQHHEPEALKCWETFEDSLWYNDAGASAAVLHNGLNLDCLMLRFQNKDWLDRSSWGWKESNSDVDSGPFQVMFVPLRSRALKTSRAAIAAHQYSMWAIKAMRASSGGEEGGSKKPVSKTPAKKITATDTAQARLQLDAAAAQAAAMAIRQQREVKAAAATNHLNNDGEQQIAQQQNIIEEEQQQQQIEDVQQDYNQQEDADDENDDERWDFDQITEEDAPRLNVGNNEDEEDADSGDITADFEDGNGGDDEAPRLDDEADDYSGADDFKQEFAGGDSEQLFEKAEDDYHAQALNAIDNDDPFGTGEEGVGEAKRRRQLRSRTVSSSSSVADEDVAS